MKQGLVLSFIGHFIAAIFLIYSQDLTTTPQQVVSEKPVSVRTLTPEQLRKELSQALDSTKTKLQIVQGEALEKPKESPDSLKTKFLSKSDQKIDFETRAQHVGKFKNVFKQGTQNKVTSQDLFRLPRNPKDLEQEKSLISKTGRLRAPAALDDGPSGEGISQTDDYLEDIAVGSQTLLNTREFIFYSFYDRIRRSLRETWNLRLESELSRLMALGVPLQFQMNTQVQVILKSGGEINEVLITKSSGVKELDQAARLAFYDAAPFPNPPQGMIDKNNSVTINWDFVVVSEAGSPIRVDIRRGP
jgi:TonB family protein